MSDLPQTVPVCYRHPTRETYVRCTRCERPICPDCMTEASVGHQCPECVAQGRRDTRPALTAFGGSGAGRAGYATKALIAINVVVMLISAATGGIGALIGGGWGGLLGGATALTDAGSVLGYAPYSDLDPVVHGIAAGEWWRLLTAMFLHYGLLHLAMNMYALWALGRNLEQALGPVRFVGLYLLAGLGGNVAAYLFTEPYAATAGASTAVFGLFAAIFVLMRRLGQSTAQIVPMIVINVVFTLTVPNISVAGHLGGLVIGGVVAAVLAYAPPGRRTLVQAIGAGAVFAVLVVLAIGRTVMILSA
jgi:membrane associated rhomboid family serine protease